MNTEKLAELLDFLFTDWEFKGDGVSLWQSVIDLIQQIFSKIFG